LSRHRHSASRSGAWWPSVALAIAAFVAGAWLNGSGTTALADREAEHIQAFERATVALFEKAAPSVVFITSVAYRRDFFSFNIRRIQRGSGSGFVWDRKGHIVTNYHVIEGASAARVTLDDRTTWDAELVGVAPEKDLAVLRIQAPSEKLQPLRVGRGGELSVGQFVMAIGNPFGLDHTMTTGVVSALGREIESRANLPIRDVVQTDAAINPGNSGGPLLDSSGALVGVNTAIFSPSGAYAGIGFAIPADTVRWVIPDLIRHGKVKRPNLGAELANRQLARRLGIDGVLIVNVDPNGPAARAGLRPTRRTRRGEIVLGDVIVAVAGEKVASPGELLLALEPYRYGQSVQLTIQRNRERIEVAVELAPVAPGERS